MPIKITCDILGFGHSSVQVAKFSFTIFDDSNLVSFSAVELNSMKSIAHCFGVHTVDLRANNLDSFSAACRGYILSIPSACPYLAVSYFQPALSFMFQIMQILSSEQT